MKMIELLPLPNPGRFGPIPVRSGRLSRFGPVGAGRFGPVS